MGHQVVTFPETVGAPDKGWACVVFDTYLDVENMQADQVLAEGFGISDVRWITLGSGVRAIGFNYDRAEINPFGIEVKAYLIKNVGVGGGRSCDIDGVAPNSSENNNYTWMF
jgi:hypothetical protein